MRFTKQTYLNKVAAAHSLLGVPGLSPAAFLARTGSFSPSTLAKIRGHCTAVRAGSPMLPEAVRRWSSDSVPEACRVDHWMNVISQAIWPVSDWTVSAGFSWEMEEARLGPLSTVLETIQPHRARRTRRDVDGSVERCCQLFVSLQPRWGYHHRGFTEMLEPGDAVLIGDGEHETSLPDGFNGIIVKCPMGWVNTWLPDPEQIQGRRIERDSRWGRVLSPMVLSLTPQSVADCPLPAEILADQIGTILALVAGETESVRDKELFNRVTAAVHDRCPEPSLVAADIATPLGLTPPLLQRLLVSQGTTFLHMVQEARVSRAIALLRQATLRERPIAEIGEAVGFSSNAHFLRTFRRITGHSPAAYRRFA